MGFTTHKSSTMAAYSLLLLFMFLIQFVPSSANYDYLMLVQQWPKTVCTHGQKRCTIPIPSMFTLHGLWPSNTTGQQPANCSPTTPFDKNVTKGLQPDIGTHWPDLYGNDVSFWRYEWVKHGTCSLNMFDQLAYFKLALHIKMRMAPDLILVLRQAGIVPKIGGTPYNTSSIVTAIKTIPNVDPIITCDSGKSSLQEVRICLDSTGTSFAPCRNAARKIANSCSSSIFLPQ